jgi:hypothetical protein
MAEGESRRRPVDVRETVKEQVDVHLHLDGPITVNVNVNINMGPAGPGPASKATLTLGGSNMPGQITVDTQNETATVGFVDDKNDDTSAPDGTEVTFTSSDDTIATVAPDSSNPLQGDITPVGVGTVQIGATFNGTALESDGATPIADPDAVSVEIDPGAAVGARISLSE